MTRALIEPGICLAKGISLPPVRCQFRRVSQMRGYSLQARRSSGGTACLLCWQQSACGAICARSLVQARTRLRLINRMPRAERVKLACKRQARAYSPKAKLPHLDRAPRKRCFFLSLVTRARNSHLPARFLLFHNLGGPNNFLKLEPQSNFAAGTKIAWHFCRAEQIPAFRFLLLR